MSVSHPSPSASGDSAAHALFERVLAVVDETPESLVAAVEARRLCSPTGSLELVAFAETPYAVQAGAWARAVEDEILADAEAALDRARALTEPDSARVVVGRAGKTLLTEVARSECTLLAVAAHGRHRRGALAVGTTDAIAIHETPCSDLLARPGWTAALPRRIVVGVDGSPGAALAAAAARSLAERLGVELLPILALGGRAVDPEVLRAEFDEGLVDPRDPVTALVAASAEGDLVVVGSGGRHRRRHASVSERIAFGAHCSVLVVREPRP